MAWIRACGGGSPAIPDGKTVTPINDVTIWQQCAGIANPTYTTLAEVLADTGILQTLMASDNAVDYLARSKQFIGNLALVPIMTSNTTPSGEAFGFSIKVDESDYSSITLNNDANAYKVFDGDTSTYPQARVGYDFGKKIAVNKVELVLNAQAGVTCTVWASDEKTQNYTKIATFTTTSPLTKETHVINNATAYRYWFVVPVGEGSFRELQFYTADGICQSSNAMTYIGQNNYASNTLLADSDWRDAICNSTYFESVLNVKVPTMTSDTTPSGTVFYNPSGVTFWQVFDGNDATDGAFPNGVGNYGGYDYGKSVRFMCARIKYTSGSSTDKFKVKGSNDGNTWDELTNEFANEQLVVANTVIGTYQKIALVETTKVSGSTNLFFYTIQFYGREDV